MSLSVTTLSGAKALQVHKDDVGAVAIINFRAIDLSTDTVLTLTGYTITINSVVDDNTADGAAFIFSGVCSIVDATLGTFSYTPIATDFDKAELQLIHITFTKSGEQETVKFGSLKVIDTPLRA